jgi:hypothetical protein
MSTMYYFLTFLRYHTSTCFGPVCSPSSGSRVYNVADGNDLTSKSAVGGLGSYSGSPTVDLEVKQIPFATLYTLSRDDGLQMGPKHVGVW